MFQQTPEKRVLFVRSLRLALLVTFGVFCIFAVNLRASGQANALTSSNLNFQARLQNVAGGIVPDGNYNVQFKLYDASSGGTLLWTESDAYVDASHDYRLRVANGYLSVNLGSTTAFPTTINWSQQLYLTMNIGGSTTTVSYDGEMNPRLPLTAVPYAFQAASASQLQALQGSYTGTLNFASSLTGGNQNFVIQDQGAAGTYNLLTQNQANVGFIQNTTTPQASSNFNITGNGTVGGTLYTGSLDTVGANTLNLGATNATTINLGGGTVNRTIGIGNSTGNDTVNIATAGGTDIVNIGTSTTSKTTVSLGSTYSTTTVSVQGGASSLSVANAGLSIVGNTTTSGTVSTTAGGAAGVGTQQLASSLYIQSRSTNLVTNGTGLLGNNYNFSGFTFDPQNVYAGSGSFSSATYNTLKLNDELIPVDPNSTYQLSVAAESTVYVAGAHAYIGVVPYDADGLQITPPMYAKYPGSTDTTLAAPLNTGDTTVTLTNASGWWNGGGVASTFAQLAWYGYTNAKGYTYPNYTYTRNSSSNYPSLWNNGTSLGAWAAGGISGNTITLSAPWPGPTLAAGAAVRNAQSGGTYKYTAASNVNVPATWTTYSGRIGGIDTGGTQSASLFPYGTANIKLLFLLNRDVTGNTTNISDISFTNNSGVFTAPTSSTVPVIVQGAASQSADLLQIQSSVGTVLSKFDANGNLIVTSTGNSSLAGKLGIGTNTPGQSLDVQGGNINTSGAIMTGGTVRIDASGNFTGGTVNTNTFNGNTLAFGSNATAATIQSGTNQALNLVGNGTGALNLGATTGANTINIGNSSGVDTITLAGGSGNDIVNIATGSGSNKINIGTATSTTAIQGSVGVGVATPLATLDLNGTFRDNSSATWSGFTGMFAKAANQVGYLNLGNIAFTGVYKVSIYGSWINGQSFGNVTRSYSFYHAAGGSSVSLYASQTNTALDPTASNYALGEVQMNGTSVQIPIYQLGSTNGNNLIVRVEIESSTASVLSNGLAALSITAPTTVANSATRNNVSITTSSFGIGTNTPGQSLDVQGGNINTSGAIMTGGVTRIDASGNFTGNGANITALNGTNITTGTVADARLSANAALYNNVTSNFTGALQQAGNNVCTMAGNCVSGGGSAIGGSGTANTLAMFTAAGTIGNSILTQTGTSSVTIAGNLTASGQNIALGNTTNGTTLTVSGKAGSTNNLVLDNTSSSGNPQLTLASSGSRYLNLVNTSTGTFGLTIQGRIGIGTNTPGQSLDVQGGNVNTSGTIMTGGVTRIDATGNFTGGTLTASSTIQGTQLISTVATGTAPLTVSSTTVVTNLNADLLDGHHASDFVAGSGSSSYIQNTTSLQQGNINLQAATSGSVAAAFSANASGSGDILDLLNGSGVVVSSVSSTGEVVFKPSSTSLTGFQIKNSGGTIFDIDTTNGRVGINNTAPAYALDVNGDINSNTAVRVGGVSVCTVSNCVPAGGSPNYVQNGTGTQTNANINIRSVATNSITAVLQGASGQTSDILDIEGWNGTSTTLLAGFSNTGLLTANGGITIGTGQNFVNGGSTLNSSIAISKSAAGSIGANTATVDVATTLDITTTAANLALTLPHPTVTTSGRIIYINNVGGTYGFTAADASGGTTVSVSAGASASFIWNGTTWTSTAVSTGVSLVGAFSLTSQPNGASISGNTITFGPADATNPGMVSTGLQQFAGTKVFSGSVAIGTSSLPNYRLDVQGGDINTSGYYRQGGNIVVNTTTGTNNIFVGISGNTATTSSSNNSALGSNALVSNTTGSNNSAFGYGALQANTSGGVNSAFGPNALVSNTTGNNNSAFGPNALISNTTGNNNSAFGYGAGFQDMNGHFVTGATLQNATAIGTYAQVQANNSIVLGSVDNAPKVGIGITVPSNTFSVSPLDYQTGTATRTNSSAVLTGTGTTWTNAMVGDIVVFADGTTNTVAGFTSATSITMGTAYAGTTDASPVYYRFHHVGFQVTSMGNIGVGNTAPAALFSVGSSSQFQVDSNGNFISTGGTGTIKTTSTSAFLVQDASSNAMFSINSSTGAITFGNATNNVVFTPSGGLVASGTAQHTKTITLTPEYAGAVLDATSDSTCSTGNNYNGTMTSGYDSSSARMNYYNWTAVSATSQCYDVVVQVPIPSDFSSWASSPLSVQAKASSTSNASYAISITDSSNSYDGNYGSGYASPGTLSTAWSNVATSGLSGTYTAGNYFTIRIRMAAKNSASLQLGNITLNYSSKY